MLEIDGSKGHTGGPSTIGNHSTGAFALNSWAANFEVYDTVHMCEEFVQARMKFLCDQYGVEVWRPYTSVLESEPWECIDNEDGIDPREVRSEFEE